MGRGARREENGREENGEKRMERGEWREVNVESEEWRE